MQLVQSWVVDIGYTGGGDAKLVDLSCSKNQFLAEVVEINFVRR